MRNTHIDIDINGNGDMLICEEGCPGKHYHIDAARDDLIDQVTTCLAHYLHHEYNEIVSIDLSHLDGETLEQLKKGIIKEGYIMPKAEAEEFLKSNDLTKKAKLQKNSLYGKTVCESDPVNHPSHYTDGKIEVIDFIEDKNLNFHLANAVKYISRAGKKDPNKEIEDLKKARWYLDRYIQKKEE